MPYNCNLLIIDFNNFRKGKQISQGWGNNRNAQYIHLEEYERNSNVPDVNKCLEVINLLSFTTIILYRLTTFLNTHYVHIDIDN